jgi:hypothetical protein
MVRLSALSFAAAFATALAATPASPVRRADLVTGCTCCGYDVSFGSNMANMETYVR